MRTIVYYSATPRVELEAAAAYFGLKNLIFRQETESLKKKWPDRELGVILKFLKKGDKLLIEDVKNMGKSSLEWLDALAAFIQKGIEIYIIERRFSLVFPVEFKQLAKLFLLIMDKEREVLSERAKKAYQAKRKTGESWGRPGGAEGSLLDPFEKQITKALKTGVTQVFLAKKYGVSPGGLSYWLKKKGLR